MTSLIKIKNNYNMILKDFIQPTKSINMNLCNNCSPFKIPENFSIEPHHVFIIFKELKSFKFFGRSEKTLWEIPVLFKKEPFLFVHGKFGLSIYINYNNENVEFYQKLFIESLIQIQKAIPYIEPLMKLKVQEKVSNGKITLLNYYSKLSNRYYYFRSQSEKHFINAQKAPSSINNKDPFNIKSINNKIEQNRIAEYYSYAMIDSFFSLLEHILVLIIPFSQSEFRINELNDLISKDWSEKYKIIFNLNSDNTVRNIFEKLVKIKELYRNPLSHGYFEKNGASLYIHWEHIGLVPMILNKVERHSQYYFNTINEITFKDICICFDSFFNYLENCHWKYGFKYIKSCLDVAFDEASRKKYLEAMASEVKFDKLIDYHLYLSDQAANMDW